MSIARHHTEWMSLLEISGPFLSLSVLQQVFPQGLESHDSEVVASLRLAFEEWSESRDNPAFHTAWLEFVRERGLNWPAELWRVGQSLPPALAVALPAHGETLRPDAALLNPDGTPRVLWMEFARTQGLQKPLVGRGWNASPAVRMAELLRATGVRLGLISNGRSWMLVHAPSGETSSYITWDAALWSEERLTWRAFASLLGGDRLFGAAENDSPERLFERSAENQQEVTDQLGMQVRRALETLVQTFDREDQNTQGVLLRGLAPRSIYEAALSVMMRLVFLFCAEEREMLPLSDPFYAANYAVSTLRAALREDADANGEEVLERRHDAWCRLLATFRAVYGGIHHEAHPSLPYGGRLFDPERYSFLEGRVAGTDWRVDKAQPLPVDNRTVLHLLEALQVLEMRVPGGEKQARVLSFRALDIEQIGHVYEGLLDHTARRANEPMLSLKGAKGIEAEVALSDLESRFIDTPALLAFLENNTGLKSKSLVNGLNIKPDLEMTGLLRRACGDEALFERVLPFAGLLRFDSPIVIRPGSLFVTQGSDRRSSGTHYTPRSLTEPLVARTLDPLVYAGFSEGVPASPQTLKSPRELLALKVLDPACGSAGVLVQVCRYLAEHLVEAWERAEAAHTGDAPLLLPYAEAISHEPDALPLPTDAEERLLEARRLVADRCLFGVDRDPLAVEMAQLSLWLITMAKGRPFSFLEHAIRVGDSLVGVDLEQLRAQSLTRQSGNGLAPVNFAKSINAALAAREHIHQYRDERDKRAQLEQAERAVEHARLLADGIVAPSFLPLKAKDRAEKRKSFWMRAIGAETIEKERDDLRADLDAALGSVHPFHWPLEFPEAFWDEHNQPRGFDAVVGNPPFIGGKRITGALGVPYRDALIDSLARGKKGNADLVAYFYLRAFDLLRPGGTFGLIATNTIAQGDTREVGLDQIDTLGGTIYAANPSQKWPGVAALEVALVHGHKGEWNATCDLAGQPVSAITPYLSAPGAVSGNPHQLVANVGESFIGSFVLGMGFVLESEEVAALIIKDARNRDVLFPYLNGEDLNSRPDGSPSRWVINFKDWPLDHASAPLDYSGPVAADYPDCLSIVERLVKPERTRLKPDGEFQLRAPLPQRWWIYADKRPALYNTIAEFQRVLVRAQVSRTHAPSFVDSGMVYSMMCIVLALQSNAEFAIVQSNMHEVWLNKFSSSLKSDQRYTPTDCFENFPFPHLNDENSEKLEPIGAEYHEKRRVICLARDLGLTKVYNLFHDPATEGDEPTQKQFGPWDDIRELRALHQRMDELVARAYGWDDLNLDHGFHPTAQGVRFTVGAAARSEILDRLLALNHQRYAEEVAQGLHDKKTASKKTGVKGKAKTAGAKKAGREEAAASGQPKLSLL